MPISGKLKTELTIESVMERASPYEIFRYFFGDFEINQVTCNHLRGDRSPSFLIGNKYGELSMYDYADSKWRGDCFNLVKNIYNCSLDEALRIIDKELSLGIQNGQDVRSKPISPVIEPEVHKRSTLIQVVTRKFTKEELAYWASYYQDINNLRQNNVFSIKKLYLNKKLFPLKDDTLRFGYYYEPGYWKIYRPFEVKRDKWFPNNVPNKTSWGLENLSKDKCTIVTKSRKDYMVLRKIYPHICSVQKEGVDAFSDEFVNKIRENSSCVYYGGDSDKPGKKASYQITEAFQFKHINPPDKLLPEVKDWADWAANEGLNKVKEHLIIKGIYD